MSVTVYEMPATTIAFDNLQSWQAEQGKLAFYHGRYFGIVESPGTDQRTLNRFVSAFEKTLPDAR